MRRIFWAIIRRLLLFFKKPSMRPSKYIDFDTGQATTAPMDFLNSMSKPWSDDQKLDLFECRVDVWTLGAAVAILRQIEQNQPPSIWSHSGYALLIVSCTYFEMIGKTLNPNSASRNTANEDFNFGFCDVYPKFKPANGIYKDKIPVPTGPHPPNPDIRDVIEFRDRTRNGLYHLGYTKSGLWIDGAYTEDFEKKTVPDPINSTLTIDEYRVNPHRVTRTIVDHFPHFVARVRATPALKNKFIQFFDQFLTA